MIGAKTSSALPGSRLPPGWICTLLWAMPVLMAIMPVSAVAEEDVEPSDSSAMSEPSPTALGLDLLSMSEPEIQARLAEVRTELLNNNTALHRLEFQLQQTGRAQELADEIKQIRRELGQLYERSEQAPEDADKLEAQMQELRRQRDDMEAERLGLLNQSEEYRVLSAQAGELREQLKSILPALPQPQPEDNAGKIE